MSLSKQSNPPRIEGVPIPTENIYECPSCAMRLPVPVESNLLQVTYHVPGKQPYSIEFKACYNCFKATVEIFQECFKIDRLDRGVSLRKMREQERTRPCGCG